MSSRHASGGAASDHEVRAGDGLRERGRWSISPSAARGRAARARRGPRRDAPRIAGAAMQRARDGAADLARDRGSRPASPEYVSPCAVRAGILDAETRARRPRLGRRDDWGGMREFRRSKPIRVLFVEDHQLLADALSAMLAREPDIEVVGIAGTVAEAQADGARAPRRRPDGLPPPRRHRRRGDPRDQGPLAGGPGRDADRPAATTRRSSSRSRPAPTATSRRTAPPRTSSRPSARPTPARRSCRAR